VAWGYFKKEEKEGPKLLTADQTANKKAARLPGRLLRFGVQG
jgi:hypothetical protein